MNLDISNFTLLNYHTLSLLIVMCCNKCNVNQTVLDATEDTFLTIKIAPVLSGLTMIGSFTEIAKLSQQ